MENVPNFWNKLHKKPTSCNMEKEMHSVDYRHSMKSDSNVNCTASPHSKENIELSLEVEIAESLKQIISTPEKYSSDLLDVTIIQPNVQQMKTSTLRGKELGHLLSSIDYRDHENLQIPSKVHKSTEPKTEASFHTAPNVHNKKHLLKSECVMIKNNQSHKEWPTKDSHKKNIQVSSAPERDFQEKIKENYSKCYPRKNRVDYVSVNRIKPMLGEIKESLRNVEARIVEMGDTNCCGENKESQSNQSNSGKFSYIKDLYGVNYDSIHNNNQIYTSPLHKKAPTHLCQNNKDEYSKRDIPCLCEHCGIIGLLKESQKRPILSIHDLYPSNDTKEAMQSEKNSTVKINKTDHHKKNNKHSDDLGTDCSNQENVFLIINKLSEKVNSLENRLCEQEYASVSRDYLKRVINKIMSLCFNKVHRHNVPVTKSASTQCCLLEIHRSEIFNDYKSKCYNVHSLLFKNKFNNNFIGENKKRYTNVSSITSKTYQHSCPNHVMSEDIEKKININTSRKKSDSYFWRWGDDILKPGLDLKTKIMSLLEVAVRNVGGTKYKNIQTVDNQMQTDSEDILSITTPKKSFRHFLDLMSERIYYENILKNDTSIKSKMKSNFVEKQTESFKIKNLERNIYEPLNKLSSIKHVPDVDITVNKTSRTNISKQDCKKSKIPKLKTYDQACETRPVKHEIFYISAENNELNNESSCGAFNENIRNSNRNENEEIHVTYFNSNWINESKGSLSHEVRQNNKIRTMKKFKGKPENWSLDEKLYYLKKLTKYQDIEKLWCDIWNQVKSYGRSKQDTIIMQVPINNPKESLKKFIELEFTIADVEIMAHKSKGYDEIVHSDISTYCEHCDSLLSLTDLKETQKPNKCMNISFTQQIHNHS